VSIIEFINARLDDEEAAVLAGGDTHAIAVHTGLRAATATCANDLLTYTDPGLAAGGVRVSWAVACDLAAMWADDPGYDAGAWRG